MTALHKHTLPPSGKFFSSEELTAIRCRPLPRHVAIIMDGNRRWAHHMGSETFAGHWAGAKTLLDVVNAASELGIQVLTVFGFSTENWERSETEIHTLFHIFESYLRDNREKMRKEGIAFHAIGHLEPLPSSLRDEIAVTEKATRDGERIDLVVALNYGGRDEMTRAARRLAEEVLSGSCTLEEISEERMGRHLYTARFGDPDLLIRTSGELRVSNFLLWQLAYTEIVVTDVLWPNFSAAELFEAVLTYQDRERRLGR